MNLPLIMHFINELYIGKTYISFSLRLAINRLYYNSSFVEVLIMRQIQPSAVIPFFDLFDFCENTLANVIISLNGMMYTQKINGRQF